MKSTITLSKRGFPLVSCLLCLFLFIDFAPQTNLSPTNVERLQDATLPPRLSSPSLIFNTTPGTGIGTGTGTDTGPMFPALFRNTFLILEAEDLLARQVTVPNLFTYPVAQQPVGKEIYVTNSKEEVTQFRMPSYTGVTGLIAHNYLAGQEFYKLSMGQRFWVQYDGTRYNYRITGSYRFKKLDPPNPSSRLIDLQNKQEFSAAEVYDRFYKGEHHVTFQTCLEGEGRLDWGLYFVVGEPELP